MEQWTCESYVVATIQQRVHRTSVLGCAWTACIGGSRNTVPPTKLAILICDDTSNAGLKRDLQQAYRAYCGRAAASADRSRLADYIHDDRCFGDSAYSVGLQVADIWQLY